VILDFVPLGNKIQIIKLLRETSNLSLSDAKHLVESAPAIVLSGVSKFDAQDLQNKLIEAGAKASIK
jgi:large subunit ribosomal protein L7/L12